MSDPVRDPLSDATPSVSGEPAEAILPASRQPGAMLVRDADRPAAVAATTHEPARHRGRHPSLGLPPGDMTAGHPAAAQRLVEHREALGTRGLELALDLDPTLDDRYDDAGFRHLLRDTGALIDRLARSIASGDPGWTTGWAEWVAPVYRRRGVPMDDLVTLTEGIRQAAAPLVDTAERASLDMAADAAIGVFRDWRRLAGDARKRNRLVAFLYRGA